MTSTIETVSLTSELVSDFLLYSTAIYNRALPDIVDGLKAAQRRALLGMSDLRLSHSGAYCKVSRLEGHVLGRYHPQGGCAGTIINMGQQAAMRYTLTDIHGNVGGSIQTGPAAGQLISEDGPAAARYLEVRSTPLAEYLYLEGLNRALGSWRPNYDDSTTEPIRFVPAAPALLLTGAQGIASGYACNFASFAVQDVVSATKAWIRNPSLSDKQLLAKFSHPPESPQGGRVERSEGISDIILRGRGSYVTYGEWQTEDNLRWGKRSTRPALIVTKLASGSSEKFLERVRDLADSDKLPGLLDAADQSSREGIRIVLVTKTILDRDNLLQTLLGSGTGLRHQHNINHVAVGVDGKPRNVSARDVIKAWHQARVEYLTQKNTRRRDSLRAEGDRLQAVLAVLSKLDKFLTLVRKSQTKADAVAGVVKGWKLSEDLARHVLSIPISTLIATEKDAVESQYRDIENKISSLEPLCQPGSALDESICAEISSLRGLCAPGRSVWLSESIAETPRQSRPLTERDRVLQEGKDLGLSTRAINKWIRENLGKGKLSQNWEKFKLERQLATRSGRRERSEALAQIKAEAVKAGLPKRGKHAWNAFIAQHQKSDLATIKASMQQWLKKYSKM